MNLKDAIRILDICTTPANAGKMGRVDYVACEEALKCLVELGKELDAKAAAEAAQEAEDKRILPLTMNG